MELYQLAYFIEVAHQQNFTRAAQRLNLAQPALSQQIRKLETELGAPLLVRGRKHTLLTAAGAAFLPRAVELIALAESAKQAVADVAQLRRGRLVVASIATLSACWLPTAIQRFRALHPHIELELREESSLGVAELVENSVAELGLLQLPVERKHFQVEELFTEPFLVLLPEGHPLAARKQLLLTELTEEAFIFYKGMVRSLTLEACRTAGFEPRVACESTELETVRALVRAGLGIAVLPKLAIPAETRQIVTVGLSEPKLERTVAMIHRTGKPQSSAAQAFRKCCL